MILPGSENRVYKCSTKSIQEINSPALKPWLSSPICSIRTLHKSLAFPWVTESDNLSYSSILLALGKAGSSMPHSLKRGAAHLGLASLSSEDGFAGAVTQTLRSGCQIRGSWYPWSWSVSAGKTENWIELLLWEGTSSPRLKMCCCSQDTKADRNPRGSTQGMEGKEHVPFAVSGVPVFIFLREATATAKMKKPCRYDAHGTIAVGKSTRSQQKTGKSKPLLPPPT